MGGNDDCVDDSENCSHCDITRMVFVVCDASKKDKEGEYVDPEQNEGAKDLEEPKRPNNSTVVIPFVGFFGFSRQP